MLRDDNIRYGIAQGDFSITAELTEGKESFRSDFGVDVEDVEPGQDSIEEDHRPAIAVAIA